MNTLARLQADFNGYVLSGNTGIIDEVVGDASGDAGQRLNVYADGYRLRLLEVLGDELPGLRAMVGNDTFEQLARHYIEQNPSHHRNVRWYGGHLPEFLQTHAPWSEQPALAQMAAFEWDLTLVFDAPDAAMMTLDELASLPAEHWPTLPLRLLPSVRCRELQWNLAAVRQAADAAAVIPALGEQAAAQCWVIWRYEFGVRYRLLEADEAALMSALAQGLTFATLCEQLQQWHADDAVAQRAVALLGRWVSEQWLRA